MTVPSIVAIVTSRSLAALSMQAEAVAMAEAGADLAGSSCVGSMLVRSVVSKAEEAYPDKRKAILIVRENSSPDNQDSFFLVSVSFILLPTLRHL